MYVCVCVCVCVCVFITLIFLVVIESLRRLVAHQLFIQMSLKIVVLFVFKKKKEKEIRHVRRKTKRTRDIFVFATKRHNLRPNSRL